MAVPMWQKRLKEGGRGVWGICMCLLASSKEMSAVIHDISLWHSDRHYHDCRIRIRGRERERERERERGREGARWMDKYM